MLSDKLIQELQQIVQEEYGRVLTVSEAEQIGSGLVGYYDLLARLYYQRASNVGNLIGSRVSGSKNCQSG